MLQAIPHDTNLVLLFLVVWNHWESLSGGREFALIQIEEVEEVISIASLTWLIHPSPHE
jgi:hypothetical protein